MGLRSLLQLCRAMAFVFTLHFSVTDSVSHAENVVHVQCTDHKANKKKCSSSTAEGFTQILPAFSLVRLLLLLSDHKSQVQNCIVLAKIFYCPTICSEFCTTFVFCINTCGWLGKIHHLRWVIDQSTTVAISETFIYYFVCVLRAKWKYSCHLQILCSF